MLDLSTGHPTFMEPFWRNWYTNTATYDSYVEYPNDSFSSLDSKFSELHKREKNCNPDGKYFLMGNGATQLISAVCYAIKMKSEFGTSIGAQPPYYYKFPDITKDHFRWVGFDYNVEIITQPNNPDNEFKDSWTGAGHRIYDLSYNWKTYNTPKKYNEDIMIFSASKAFGLAGLRFGWAWISDVEIYTLAKEFIENQTGGVSSLTQETILYALGFLDLNTGFFKDHRKILNDRWKRLKSLPLKKIKLKNNSGMFLMVQGKLPRTVSGISGAKMAWNADETRLNIGCSETEFNKLVEILRKL